MKSQFSPFAVWTFLACLLPVVAFAQEEAADSGTADSARRIIIEASGDPVEPPFLYRASARSSVSVGADRVGQVVEMDIEVVQGKAKTFVFGLVGSGVIESVTGESVTSWAVRQREDGRFLDIQVAEGTQSFKTQIRIQESVESLPADVSLLVVTPGESVGFNSLIEIQYDSTVRGDLVRADGFIPLASTGRTQRLQSSLGGELELRIQRRDSSMQPVEVTDATLVGDLAADGKSISFRLQGNVLVSELEIPLGVLEGNVAVSEMPESDAYRLRLTYQDDKPVYELVFSKTGSIPIDLQFVAAVAQGDGDWQAIDFAVSTSAVVPMTLRGLASDLEFLLAQDSVVPIQTGNEWSSFLPATGHVRVRWRAARDDEEGGLFFTTSARIDATVGPGLLRQSHAISYQVLQGELKELELDLDGPGEILNVVGPNIVSWKVADVGGDRKLLIGLSQPMTGIAEIVITSQTAVGAFPVRVDALRVVPLGVIRHSGFVRVTNAGSVRIEPTDLQGLTQLAPEQFPGDASEARQTYVYRFPAADHAYTIAADRIQPEINVSEIITYMLSATDRVIAADLELDIRDAGIREWTFNIPEDYAVVSVSGAAVADYVVGSDVEEGQRSLKVLFNQEVLGRQLISIQLEKNEAAVAGSWELPRIRHSEANTIRSDIGIAAAPGYRVTPTATEFLVEKPLSYFPRATDNLQEAFRVRESNWSATMAIELLDRSIRSDVFHLYSLSQGNVYGSALINYFVTGAPTSEWRLTVPPELGNVAVDGQDIRTWRREGDTLVISLHQPVMGPYTLLITFEQKPDETNSSFSVGNVVPLDTEGERGYIQVVSPMQVELNPLVESSELLVLDALELPAEFRLLSTAPALGTWQYTERPFELSLRVRWFQPGITAAQVVEFSEANSRVSPDGEQVTDLTYYVKSRGLQTLRIELPPEPIRLWAVTVNGQPVTARQSDDGLLIPLPGGADPNVPVEVTLRMGKPSIEGELPSLALPIVFVPVLKTQWTILGDENYSLVPAGGNVEPLTPAQRQTGYEWVTQVDVVPFIAIAAILLLAVFFSTKGGILSLFGFGFACLAMVGSGSAAWDAFRTMGPAEPLQLHLPVLSAGESIEMKVQNVPNLLINISWPGLGLIAGGLFGLGLMMAIGADWAKRLFLFLGVALVSVGVLLQRGSAPWFFAFLSVAVLLWLVLPAIASACSRIRSWWKNRRELRAAAASAVDESNQSGGSSSVVTTLLAFVLVTLVSGTGKTHAEETTVATAEYAAASVVEQSWTITKATRRLVAVGSVTVAGNPGDQFVLLRSPATLTKFESDGLRLSKKALADGSPAYILSIPVPQSMEDGGPSNEVEAAEDSVAAEVQTSVTLRASFEYLMEAVDVTSGVPVSTGPGAIQRISLRYDEPDLDVLCSTAARISLDANETATGASLLLGPGAASVQLRPRKRDITSEQTKFFVECENLYIPGPGVVDGIHRMHVRVAQGRVSNLNLVVPDGLTVSDVNGPVSNWQFDADQRKLRLRIEGAEPGSFTVSVLTQRGLGALPADLTLTPMGIEDAEGEVGLVALAFGEDAQPEKVEAQTMSVVNLGDFDSGLLAGIPAVLHNVFRYGDDDGSLQVRVTGVDPEVRVASRQVLSLGEERVVLAVNFAVEITRSGLFQLSFPMPNGMEVESLSGDALHHWAELDIDGQRTVIMHLNGKTIGDHSFALTLTATSPTGVTDWEIPRFEISEANRQTGQLVVRPNTGIRLHAVSRQNVSEVAPREFGGSGNGALAFRLLQRDWSLQLGIERLDPWVTGQVLHEITLREGQTRTHLLAEILVQNASIRTLQVKVPGISDDEVKSLRASGATVSDFVRSTEDPDVWEIRFKRRVMGKVQFQIEYERRGDRAVATETVQTLELLETRQVDYFVCVRSGGRIEVQSGDLPDGWQTADWNSVPETLRDLADRNVPAIVLRVLNTDSAFTLDAVRHSLADALKLRVADGELTTILSPTGDQVTAVDLTMEVIQRSSLSVQLPSGGELFSVFVNGESVHSVRRIEEAGAWQFYILPGMDDRSATVRFVYSLTGNSMQELELISPRLNVPLENVQWHVVVPQGMELVDNDGNMELVGEDSKEEYDRGTYLEKVRGKRDVQARQATQLLKQANQLLMEGEQTKARWALNSVANQYGLDAASNEDARVQLENLQTQQAIVGLNTRRQRFYLDNNRGRTTVGANEQFEQAAAANPILQQDQLNFRPQQLSQLLGGNTQEDNAVLEQIAWRLVQHQRTTEPAPQAILISLPEEGTVYNFVRSVQVAENAPLEIELAFRSQYKMRLVQWITLGGVLFLIVTCISVRPFRKRKAAAA